MELSDPRWRINNLYKIVNKEGKLVTFKENEHQALVNADPAKEIVILKARQIGFSTARIIRLLDKTIWNENQTSVIIAHENDALKKLFRIVYRAYKYMDPDLRPVLDRGGGSKYEFFFPEINSRIYCDLESRSDTIHNLHVSEYGLMKNDDKVKATVDAVPITGEITFESTPKGLNHFYEKWNNGSGKKFFFPWYAFKEYRVQGPDVLLTDEELSLVDKAKRLYNIDIDQDQIRFRRWKIEQKGGNALALRSFLEEFPEDDQSCFLSSGEAVMDLHLIKSMMDRASPPIKEVDGVKIYKEPNKDHAYVCGADVAEGVRKDFSVGVVLDVHTREVVAKYRGQIKPYDFAHKLNEICKYYNFSNRPATELAVERNNHGHAVLLELNEHLQYPSLYVHNDDRLGWKTDQVTRPIMIDAFIHAMENQYIVNSDKDIFAECLTLIDNNGKIEAADGKFDDCIMATAIALQLLLRRLSNLSIYENIENKILS